MSWASASLPNGVLRLIPIRSLTSSFDVTSIINPEDDQQDTALFGNARLYWLILRCTSLLNLITTQATFASTISQYLYWILAGLTGLSKLLKDILETRKQYSAEINSPFFIIGSATR